MHGYICGYEILTHGKFLLGMCWIMKNFGYDFGYIGTYLCMAMEKFGSCVWACQKILVAVKFGNGDILEGH